jgi:hypothetical protein
MASGFVKYGAAGLVVLAAAVGYRLAFAKPNTDNLNYEPSFRQLDGWKDLPHNPNTLALYLDPKTNAMLRASATQIVSDFNPEPDVDTKEMVRRVVENAQKNQPEYKTTRLKSYDNGRVVFEMFHKTNASKTIVGAMAVRGNTTLLVSISNTGEGGKRLAEGEIKPLLAFLDTFDLKVSDKWIRIHEKYGE